MASCSISRMTLLSWLVFFWAPTSRGHTLMQNPVPFPSQLKSNAPMNKDGSNWPCSGETEYHPDGVMNVWERGSTQYLQAMGGASHGGGSCQISVTKDVKPTRDSTWKVIHSIHGGCPIRNLTNGNYGFSATTRLPSIYNFTVPAWTPLGRVVMAWTWYGRWSEPEMFMNCAPVLVLGGATDKDLTQPELEAQYDAAPFMFEANNGNGCWTGNHGSCVVFPEPGDSLEVNSECPLDPVGMFTGVCDSSRRLALLPPHGAGSRSTHILALGGVLLMLIVALVTYALVQVCRRGRVSGEGYTYSKVSGV
ncbi:hypothetical protein QTJ16_006110 [Diplocarpon rosae]|uniref:Lytic polysaccharide monooxygenase n=1 Tax=Diplocarpon rosae TaxID=946125 RepID=A0AAD9SUW7_9HELO|nr:hypothetical protein QTJ16_006110 [Diplocarpon rosae]